MTWWLVLAFVLFEVVIAVGASFRGHHGGRYSPGGGFVAVHVCLFGGLITGLVMSAELLVHVWVRADLPYRTSAAIRRVTGNASSPGPKSHPGGSTTFDPAVCNGP